MIGVDLIGQIRRAYFEQHRSIKEIVRTLTDNVRDLKPAILSAFISANKFGLWVPNEHVYQLPDASFLCEYFKCVGKL